MNQDSCETPTKVCISMEYLTVHIFICTIETVKGTQETLLAPSPETKLKFVIELAEIEALLQKSITVILIDS